MNGIALITLDGQTVVLKFGMPALRRIAEKMAQQDLFNGEHWNDLGISHILFAGYANHCAMMDQPVVLPFEKFYSYVEDVEDDATIKEMAAAIACFVESKHVQALIDKKKATNPEMTSPSIGTT